VNISLVKSAHAASLSNYYAPGRALGADVTLGQLLTPLIANASILIGLLSFAVLLISGIKYISSAGNPQAVEQSQKMITYAIIGLILSVLAYWITRIIFIIVGGNI
jgi:hypothetical protein